MRPTSEQKQFLNLATSGANVLVNACIGSGKTTAIQSACNRLPDRNILYLTYNRRLMQDARTRIVNPNVDVHTYHSFAGTCLHDVGIASGSIRDVPLQFVRDVHQIKNYDTVIVDEYQDLEKDLAEMLVHICRLYQNTHQGRTPQFLVVGDVDQKIYDYTRFVADEFIHQFMSGLDGGFQEISFTSCFRLSAKHAADLGQAWGKSIIGKNTRCKVRVERNMNNLVRHLGRHRPNQILVLGANQGVRPAIQNMLEESNPRIFNKDTVYSSVSSNDSDLHNMDTSEAAIFTTYDSAKGLERDLCVVCNFTQQYLDARAKYSTSRDILKNLFLVAASRGKKEIIFYIPEWQDVLPIDVVGNLGGTVPIDMRPVMMSSTFEYRKMEDLDLATSFIRSKVIQNKNVPIHVERTDGLIDLSPCINRYVQARFFKKWNTDVLVDEALNDALASEAFIELPDYNPQWQEWRKILYLIALETGQARYFKQITAPYVKRGPGQAITERLRSVFSGNEDISIPCSAVFSHLRADNKSIDGTKALNGYVNVRKGSEVYELRFVSELQDEDRLLAALYAVVTGIPSVRLWNLYDNCIEEISTPDPAAFMETVCRCATNGVLDAGSVQLPVARGGPRVLQLPTLPAASAGQNRAAMRKSVSASKGSGARANTTKGRKPAKHRTRQPSSS